MNSPRLPLRELGRTDAPVGVWLLSDADRLPDRIKPVVVEAAGVHCYTRPGFFVHASRGLVSITAPTAGQARLFRIEQQEDELVRMWYSVIGQS